MSVMMFKLVNGEEILATVDLMHQNGDVMISDPVTIMYTRQSETQVGIGFAPFMPQAEGPIHLFAVGLLAKAEAKDRLLAEYNRHFSKIQIVPANTIH